MYYIYQIQFPNGKVYIGQSKALYHRMNQYKNLKSKSTPLLHNALKKYGLESCLIIIPAQTNDINKIDEMEKFYISAFCSNYSNCGYNLESGGHSNKFGMKGRHHTKEAIKKIAESGKGRPSGFKGKNHSEETIEALRLVNNKLSIEDVKEIKILLNIGFISIKDIAKKYNISYNMIWSIKKNKRWKGVGDIADKLNKN